VHDEVHVGQSPMDFYDPIHRKHRAVRRAVELVGAVARTDGDRKCVDAGTADELDGLVGVGEARLVGTVSVLNAADCPQLALDGDTGCVCALDNFARDADVVLEVGWRLAVGEK
jgi:hypothetical protein